MKLFSACLVAFLCGCNAPGYSSTHEYKQEGEGCTLHTDCSGALVCVNYKCANADRPNNAEPEPTAAPPKKWNSMPLTVFKATLPTVPTEFYVAGKLSDYYNYEYSKFQHRGIDNTYYSVKLCDADFFSPGMGWCRDNAELHGYIKKTDAQSMFESLKDGRYHLLHVQIAYPPTHENSGVATMYWAEPEKSSLDKE